MPRRSNDDPNRTAGDGSVSQTIGATDGGRSKGGSTDDLQLSTGAAVGRYIVLHELARGGMGVIYAAYDPELDRKLALKLLRSRSSKSSESKGPRARLVREAQALARVSHPNVVTVHDVGVHGGDVFVAMELVEGGTLKSWWKKQTRRWQDTLEILCRAGEGLAAAHEQGVVHRDFKPDNVLIGDDGRVAVADFGLARAADGALERESLSRSLDVSISTTTGERFIDMSVELTRTGAVLGTPAYMAPEQHRGRPGDFRTDIFSFCVTAYEAFYGLRPFEGETMVAVASNVLQGAVRPPPPDRWIPPRIHQALLSGLAVDPRERPESMTELVAMLRPPARRLRKHWAVLGAGLLVATAVGGYALGTSRSTPCSPGADRFSGIWDETRRHALADAFAATARPFATDLRVRTEAALDHTVERWVEEAQAVCEATHVHRTQSEALLDVRMACLDRRADDLRVAVQTLEQGDAELLSHALDVVRGIPELSTCADVDVLERMALPIEPEARATAEQIQEQLATARSLRDGGRPKDALPVVEQAAALARDLDHAHLVGESLLVLASIHQRLDRRSLARVELEEAMAAAIEAGGDRLAARIAIESVYAVGYTLSDVAGAEGWDRQAQAWLARLGTSELLDARRLDNRGIVYSEAGRTEEAMADLRQARSIYTRVLQSDHPSVASNLVHIADVLIAQGHYDEAVQTHREAITLYEAAYGPEHPSLLPPLNNLGVALMDLSRLDEARELFGRTYGLAVSSVGRQSRSAALALRNLSAIDRAQGKVEEAIDKARKAVAIYQLSSEGVDKGMASALGSLAVSLAAAKQFEEATEYFRQTHAAHVELLGPDHISTVYAENNLGTVLADQGQHEQGLRHLRSALSAKERLLGSEHPNLASTLGSIGETLRAKDEPAEALEYFERAEAIQRKALGSEHPGVADALVGRGGCHLALDQAAEARPLLEQAVEIFAEADIDAPRLAKARFTLARALAKTGDEDRAVELAREALAGVEDSGEPGAKLRAEVTAWLEGR